jgi:hypothetical protein
MAVPTPLMHRGVHRLCSVPADDHAAGAEALHSSARKRQPTAKSLPTFASHRKLSVTALIEQWAEKEEERIVAKMKTKQKHDYEDCIAQ